MLNNLLKEYYSTKSPHLLISREWFYRIKSNIVLIKSPYECTNGKNRCIHWKQKKKEQISDEIGFITYNLCLNAQTPEKHTECDTSYTVITVPNQVTTKFRDGIKNQGRFEFNINEKYTLVVPLEIGTSLTYSGFCWLIGNKFIMKR